MKKFFLFRTEKESQSSGNDTSNSGFGISTISMPADNVSLLTTKLGAVVITFNESSAFETTFLREGESLPKTKVEVACNVGDETDLLEQILNFISNPSGKSVMRFDNVGGNSTSSKFNEEVKTKAIVPTLAVNTVSGDVSLGDEALQYQNTIAGINFFGKLPTIDFNHEGLAGFANTDTVSSWANAGTGSGAYSISSVVSTPFCNDPASADVGLTTKSVFFETAEHMVIPTFRAQEEYILYIVFSTRTPGGGHSNVTHIMYGDAAGETMGPSGRLLEDGAIAPALQKSIVPSTNLISIRHGGAPAPMPATAVTSVDLPQQILPPVGPDDIPCHVLVVRRDEFNNVFVYGRSGEIIAELLASEASSFSTASKSGPLEGALTIERLGTSGDLALGGGPVHKQSIARFGVIEGDPGTDFASKLAQDLFTFYNKP